MSDAREITAPPNGGLPNHPRWGAILRPKAVDPGSEAKDAQALIEANGWSGSWVWSVYDYHHFHPRSHEALLCVSGGARLLLGGPNGTEVEVGPGDGLILPAGFGHCRLGGEVQVVGAYPPGQENPEILRADPAKVEVWRERAAGVPRPETDPFDGGPFGFWT